MFSKACEYGIRAAIYLAGQSLSGRKVSLKEVSMAIDSPEAYTSKILQLLSRSSIIVSDKGPTGGFSITQLSLETTKLSNLVYAIDGDDIYRGCGLGLKVCNESMPCPVHFEFKKIREDLKNMLEETSIKELALEFKEGLSFLKI